MRDVSVLHVSAVRPPYDTRIFENEARSLAARGFRVDAAMAVERAELADGVTIRPLGPPSASRFQRIVRTVRALRYMLHPYDIVHIHDAELLIAGAVAWLFGKRVIYDAEPAAGAIHRVLERLVIPRFAGVVAAMPDMLDAYRDAVPPERMALVRNVPQHTSAAFLSARHAKRPMEGPYVVQTGGVSHAHAFHVLVEAAEVLRGRGVGVPIVILGKVAFDTYSLEMRDVLSRRAEAAGIEVLGPLPYHEMLRWVAHARAGIASYLCSENTARCLSTKIFEYFAFGLPVVVSDYGINARVVREHHAGLLAAADKPGCFAAAIELLVRHANVHARLSAASAEAAKAYAFESDVGSLLALYERVLAPAHPRASSDALLAPPV